jgi:hypothetical protein
MFKKTHNTPPRPKPSVTKQVLSDVNNAPEGDVVFMLILYISGIMGK